MTIGALAVIAFQIEAITFPYPLDYGEAPLIDQAVQLNKGNSIYRASIDQPPYTISNYPPVYVLIMALFESLFGPAYWYGRMISTLSALSSAVFIVLIVYSRSRNLFVSIIPGLLFINIPYVASWSTLARIDHLALFFALAGLYFIFKNEHLDQTSVDGDIIAGSICFILAIYTRQSYALAAPMAGFIYLIHKDRRRGFLLAGIVGGVSLLLFIIINALSSGGFYFNIVTANINPFGFDRMIHSFRNYFDSIPVIFILAAISLVLSINQTEGWTLLVGYVFGGFLSALTIGKIGSNVNYFLEFTSGLCLLIGFGMLVLYRKCERPLIVGLLIIFSILIGWQGIGLIRYIQNESRDMLDSRVDAVDDLEMLALLVRQNNDRPILADEYLGMILLSGQDLYLQPFEVTQLANASIFDQAELIEEIEDETFSLILLQEGSWWSYVVQERWTPEMLDAIHQNYRLTAQLEHTNVYQPKTSQIIEVPTNCPLGIWPLPTDAYLGYQFRDGMLTFYGAGTEGVVPVKTPVSGEVFRPENFPEGSLIIVHDDPLMPGSQSILLFGDMRSFRGDRDLVVETFPVGVEGIMVKKGDVIGYQSMWSGRPFQQYWLHIKLGIAPFMPDYLVDYDLLLDNLINPADYFGIRIEEQTSSPRPVKCQDYLE